MPGRDGPECRAGRFPGRAWTGCGASVIVWVLGAPVRASAAFAPSIGHFRTIPGPGDYRAARAGENRAEERLRGGADDASGGDGCGGARPGRCDRAPGRLRPGAGAGPLRVPLQGAVESAAEQLLHIKTTAHRVEGLRRRLRDSPSLRRPGAGRAADRRRATPATWRGWWSRRLPGRSGAAGHERRAGSLQGCARAELLSRRVGIRSRRRRNRRARAAHRRPPVRASAGCAGADGPRGRVPPPSPARASSARPRRRRRGAGRVP